MHTPIVHTFDTKKVKELLNNSDPYLQDYVRALQEVSDGWERLFHDCMKKRREELKKFKQ